jgi:hypothetical protein
MRPVIRSRQGCEFVMVLRNVSSMTELTRKDLLGPDMSWNRKCRENFLYIMEFHMSRMKGGDKSVKMGTFPTWRTEKISSTNPHCAYGVVLSKSTNSGMLNTERWPLKPSLVWLDGTEKHCLSRWSFLWPIKWHVTFENIRPIRWSQQSKKYTLKNRGVLPEWIVRILGIPCTNDKTQFEW